MKSKMSLIIYLLMTSIIGCTFDGLPQKADTMIREYRAVDRFSGTVLIAHDGNIIYNQGFGFLDRDLKIPNTPQTRLKIGSIVKDFTAVIILRLMEQNKLDLDDTIGKYIRDFPPDIADKVTIRQLLRHESGFGDYLMLPGFRRLMPSIKTVPQIIGLFRDQQLLFEPGSAQRYSNSGYTVLGSIIEKVMGMTYFEAVRDEILNKLQMTETVFDWHEIDKFVHKPKWYLRSSTGKFQISPFDEWPSPSGGAYSTGEDMLKFEWSLLHDTLLLSEPSKVLLANQFKPGGDQTWPEILSNPDIVVAKAGGSPGSNAVIINDFGHKYIIIVMANYDEPIAEVIANNILSMITSGTYNPPEADIFEKCFTIFSSNGIKALEENFPKLLADQKNGPPADFILNRVGYDLLNEDRLPEAIEILSLNTVLFPGIANTWDSLGEAYLRSGNKSQAKKHYNKAIELDPENLNTGEILRQLNSSE